jgi:hypothetical protein
LFTLSPERYILTNKELDMILLFMIIGGAAGGSLGWLLGRANKYGAEENAEASVAEVRT